MRWWATWSGRKLSRQKPLALWKFLRIPISQIFFFLKTYDRLAQNAACRLWEARRNSALSSCFAPCYSRDCNFGCWHPACTHWSQISLEFMLVARFHLLLKKIRALSSAECFKRRNITMPFHVEEASLSIQLHRKDKPYLRTADTTTLRQWGNSCVRVSDLNRVEQ